jgi:hypothetical protein
MAKKRKAFECVKMKHDIQAKIMAEYEARKGEFSSFVDFINTRANESPWTRKMRRRAKASR